MDYRKEFVVEPGAKVRLSKIDASYKGKHETHEAAVPEMQKHIERLGKLQYLLAISPCLSCYRPLMPPARPGLWRAVDEGRASMNAIRLRAIGWISLRVGVP